MAAPAGVTSAAAEELAVYAWSGELPDAIVKDFEKETGITVRFDTFDSNESLIAKLLGGRLRYDVVNPSQYAVQILAKKGSSSISITPRSRTSKGSRRASRRFPTTPATR